MRDALEKSRHNIATNWSGIHIYFGESQIELCKSHEETPAVSAALFVRGIRVKGAARLKAVDIFVPLAMPFGIKHAGFPYIMQMTIVSQTNIIYRFIKTNYCRARCFDRLARCIQHVRCPLERAVTV